MMQRALFSTLMVSALAVAATSAAQQPPGNAPGQPDPADRGGEFVIVGCLTRPAPQPAGGPLFVLTNVTTQTGEARVIGAMGAGVPTTTKEGPSPRPTDPPDIVQSQYRVVSDDADIDFAKHVNHKVRMRGALMGQATTPAADAASSSAAHAGSHAGATQTFMAEDVEMVADSCS
jgi:hypothetical protein